MVDTRRSLVCLYPGEDEVSSPLFKSSLLNSLNFQDSFRLSILNVLCSVFLRTFRFTKPITIISLTFICNSISVFLADV